MSLPLRVIIDIALVGGAFFALAGALGILKMPDTFSRMQAATNVSTFGLLGILLGALIYAIADGQGAATIIKIALIGIFALCTNPLSAHALSRAAYRAGIRPRRNLVCDDYGRDNPHDD